MKKIFKEYHQFSEEEFKKMWETCLFVFDTNTLLNMYRYSRATVDAYFNVLNELKKKQQLWIPYQVGYEFYENRINIITEYEKSYDEILSILEKAKTDIEVKYKNHPFLDLAEIKEDMNKGLSQIDRKIKQAKKEHPKWLENDEVLEKINKLFKGNVGSNYEEAMLTSIRCEGKERYDKKIPPGFKDHKKDEDKKYGDLTLWYQIIDQAKLTNKPIILISGDIKEDWWLEKDGKRLMPLPQLKKEMLDKANVDFHIYTADRFLELFKTGEKKIDENTIKEVKKIRELEEVRMLERRLDLMKPKKMFDMRDSRVEVSEYLHLFDSLESLVEEINQMDIHPARFSELNYVFSRIRELRNIIAHRDMARDTIYQFQKYMSEIFIILDGLIRSEKMEPSVTFRFTEFSDRLEYLKRRSRDFHSRYE